MRVAIYARVSTDDKGQDPENQLTQLREWCASCNHTIVNEYVDYESGRKAERREFNRLFEDAHRRQFDLVMFWALDRFSREGMVPTILHLQRLASYGVSFHSFTEAHLATDNELVRNILLALLASLAKVEAQKISERTKADPRLYDPCLQPRSVRIADPRRSGQCTQNHSRHGLRARSRARGRRPQ